MPISEGVYASIISSPVQRHIISDGNLEESRVRNARVAPVKLLDLLECRLPYAHVLDIFASMQMLLWLQFEADSANHRIGEMP